MEQISTKMTLQEKKMDRVQVELNDQLSDLKEELLKSAKIRDNMML